VAQPGATFRVRLLMLRSGKHPHGSFEAFNVKLRGFQKYEVSGSSREGWNQSSI